MPNGRKGYAMTEHQGGDWREVGESFRQFGVQLRDHAVAAGGAVKGVGSDSGRILDQLTDAMKQALREFDQTVTDPAVGDSARKAATMLLDAIKAEINRPSEPRTEPPRAPTQTTGE